jgi:WD40 repeat protein
VLSATTGGQGPGLWEFPGLKEVKRWEGPRDVVWRVAFSPRGDLALSAGGVMDWSTSAVRASADCSIWLWDVKTGEPLHRFQGHLLPVWCAQFTPDGHRIVSGSADGTIRVWDVALRKELYQLRGHKADVHSLAIAPDGRRLVSGGMDGTVRLWDLEERRELEHLADHSAGILFGVAYSPTGKHILFGGQTGLELWLPAEP